MTDVARGAVLSFLALLCAAGLPARQARFGERVDVEVVDLEVTAFDAAGRPVTDLGADDFTLLVDGEAAEIVDFAPHFDAEPATPAPAAGTPAAPAAADPARSRVWLVYVDLSRMANFRRAIAVRDVQQFFRTAVPRGDRAMVASFDGWALRLLLPLTDRLQDVPRALDPLARGALPPSRELLAFNLTEDDVERQRRAAIRALRDFAAMAGGLRGRLTMLFAGGGFDFGSAGQEMRPRLMAEYEKTRNTLVASGITVHTLFAWTTAPASSART